MLNGVAQGVAKVNSVKVSGDIDLIIRDHGYPQCIIAQDDETV